MVMARRVLPTNQPNVHVSSFEAGLIARALEIYSSWHETEARKKGILPSEMAIALGKLAEMRQRFKELI
jgi:hypothetical protein